MGPPPLDACCSASPSRLCFATQHSCMSVHPRTLPCVSAQLSALLYCCDSPRDAGDAGRWGCSAPLPSAWRVFSAGLAGTRPRGLRRLSAPPAAAAAASPAGPSAPTCCVPAAAASAAAAAAAASGAPGGSGGLPGEAGRAGTSSKGDGGGRFHDGQAPAAGSAADGP